MRGWLCRCELCPEQESFSDGYQLSRKEVCQISVVIKERSVVCASCCSFLPFLPVKTNIIYSSKKSMTLFIYRCFQQEILIVLQRSTNY